MALAPQGHHPVDLPVHGLPVFQGRLHETLRQDFRVKGNEAHRHAGGVPVADAALLLIVLLLPQLYQAVDPAPILNGIEVPVVKKQAALPIFSPVVGEGSNFLLQKNVRDGFPGHPEAIAGMDSGQAQFPELGRCLFLCHMFPFVGRGHAPADPVRF